MARHKDQQNFEEDPVSLGSLYSEIKVSHEEFGQEQGPLVEKTIHPFEKFCKKIHSMAPSLGKGEKLSAQNKQALEFLGWNISGEEIGAAYNATMIVSFVLSAVLGIIIFLSPISHVIGLLVNGNSLLAMVYIFLPLLAMSAYTVYFVQTFPVRAAKAEQIRALTYVPEILGYMVMSMKLSPNLEKAIEFGAEHGHGKIADDFRNILWETQIGVHNTISEALDLLAYRWGEYSQEFKKALMRIRASVIEPSESKRFALLDKTMDEILDSIRTKMEQYARDLSQPSIILFYLGVLLPLILIIILPVGSSFSGAPLANPLVLGLIYVVILPVLTYVFARTQIISKRPPTFEPPKIRDDFPGLPPKNKMILGNTLLDVRMVVAAILIVGFLGSFYLSSQGIPPKGLYSILNVPDDTLQLVPADKARDAVMVEAGLGSTTYFNIPDGELHGQLISNGVPQEKAVETVLVEEKKFFTKSDHDIAPYNLLFGVLITISFAASIYLYYTNIYKRKIQLELVQLEQEFKDSLYIIASRMGENKPLEDALKSTQEFLPQYKISQTVFPKIMDNISILAMPLDKAIFDKNFGALKNIPSTVISSGMRLLVDSVELGVNVAARTMISLSIQLSNQEKVNSTLKLLVNDITSMMRVMSLFIAPMVLGITTALQKIVIITLSSIASSDIGQSFDLSNVDSSLVSGLPSNLSSMNIGNFIDPSAIASMATPTEFIFIIAIFVVEVVIVMTYFTTKIEEENDLLFNINLAKFLPIAVITFVSSIIASNALIGGFVGG